MACKVDVCRLLFEVTIIDQVARGRGDVGDMKLDNRGHMVTVVLLDGNLERQVASLTETKRANGNNSQELRTYRCARVNRSEVFGIVWLLTFSKGNHVGLVIVWDVLGDDSKGIRRLGVSSCLL